VSVEVIVVTKVYTPAEVAQVLKVTDNEVMQLVQQGQLSAFQVIDHVRIKEEALIEFMNRPYSGLPNGPATRPRGRRTAGERRRNCNPRLVAAARESTWEQIRQVAPDLLIRSRTEFTANGKQGVLRVSTTPSGPREDYWFGFPERVLNGNLPLFILPVLADRQTTFVIPYARHKAAFDGLASDKRGYRKFYVTERSGTYYLTGKGIDQPVPLDSYVNAFDRLR
jgi:excisionase family DNA binding protein